MPLSLPILKTIDRRVPYQPFLLPILRIPAQQGAQKHAAAFEQPGTQPGAEPGTQPNTGTGGPAGGKPIVIYDEPGGTYGHRPGDPSPFLTPESRGWSCPPLSAAPCTWLGWL